MDIYQLGYVFKNWESNEHALADLRQSFELKQHELKQAINRQIETASSMLLLGNDGVSEMLANWLIDSEKPGKCFFVAAIFSNKKADKINGEQRIPLPQSLFHPMLHTGILEQNPSFNKVFIEPCWREFGPRAVLEVLFNYIKTGNNNEKAGAASASYWLPEVDRKDSRYAKLLNQFHVQMLEEFVNNDNLLVRQRMIGLITINKRNMKQSSWSLVDRVIQIARNHSDEYIRHRIEWQLGNSDSLHPIPTQS